MNREPMDKLIIVAVLGLLVIGAFGLYSTTSVLTPDQVKMNQSQFSHLKKHVFSIVIGFAMLLAAYRLGYGWMDRWGWIPLVIATGLLLLVFVPGIGHETFGARRWVRFGGFSLQPSELVKLAMILFLAGYMSCGKYDAGRPAHFLMPVVLMVVIQGAFMLQRDFGATMMLGALTLSMLFLWGVRVRYLIGVVVGMMPAVAVWLMEDYRRARLLAFLYPEKYADTYAFQLRQSKYAFANGWIAGVGPGQSRQKLAFLPEDHTDFILAVIAEELGFIVMALILLMYLTIFIRGAIVASKSRGSLASYLAMGLTLMISYQALINVGVVTGMLPTKGLPLPFISYGGSAMMANMMAVGLMLRLSHAEEPRVTTESALDLVMARKRARRQVYGVRA